MNLKDWRKEKGWRQEDLADKLGEPRPTYQSWESGRSFIPPGVQAKIRKLGYGGKWPQENEGKIEAQEQGRVTGALPEHIADAYQIIFEAVQAASSDLMAIDPKKAGLVIGLVAQEVAKGGKEEVRTTLVRRAEVLLGLG